MRQACVISARWVAHAPRSYEAAGCMSRNCLSQSRISENSASCHSTLATEPQHSSYTVHPITKTTSGRTMASILCERCSRIDFAALRGPSLAEVNDLYADRNARHIYGSKSADASLRINLGTFKRIREGASRCRLCGLFCHIIDRQGAIGTSNRDLTMTDICFVAAAGAVSSYFGSIGNIQSAQSLGFVLQRLTVTAHENLSASKYGNCVAYLSHVLHARVPGSIDISVRGRTYDAKEVPDAMLLGARPRPLQLDDVLLRSWIEVCSNEHGARCAE